MNTGGSRSSDATSINFVCRDGHRFTFAPPRSPFPAGVTVTYDLSSAFQLEQVIEYVTSRAKTENSSAGANKVARLMDGLVRREGYAFYGIDAENQRLVSYWRLESRFSGH